MRVQLRVHLPVEADILWQALRTPAVFQAVSSPLLAMTSVEPSGLPELWKGDGPHLISISALGLLALGTQTIDASFSLMPDGTRVMTDAGQPQSGALTAITQWRHRMAVTALPDGTTLYRDRLDFSAGVLTPLMWLSLWAFWQWRGLRLRRLARRRFQNLLAPA